MVQPLQQDGTRRRQRGLEGVQANPEPGGRERPEGTRREASGATRARSAPAFCRGRKSAACARNWTGARRRPRDRPAGGRRTSCGCCSRPAAGRTKSCGCNGARWTEPFSADGKTGPRKVLLNAQALAIVERQPRTESPYVFPSASDSARAISQDLPLWYEARKRAGIEDVRLHDLRHTFASHAVMQGVPLPVVARLLGHRNVRMTLRYAHVADRDVEAAAERVGAAPPPVRRDVAGARCDGRADRPVRVPVEGRTAQGASAGNSPLRPGDLDSGEERT